MTVDDKQRANVILSRATALFDPCCDPDGRTVPGTYAQGWEGFLVSYGISIKGQSTLRIFEPHKTSRIGRTTKLKPVFVATWRVGEPCHVEHWKHGAWEDRFFGLMPSAPLG